MTPGCVFAFSRRDPPELCFDSSPSGNQSNCAEVPVNRRLKAGAGAPRLRRLTALTRPLTGLLALHALAGCERGRVRSSAQLSA